MRRVPAEQASAWLLDEGIHPYPLVQSRTHLNLQVDTEAPSMLS